MKLTAAVRNRASEIIAGVLLIVHALSDFVTVLKVYAPYIDFRDTPWELLVTPVISAVAALFYLFLGVMVIFRAYCAALLKIVYCITALAVLADSSGGSLLRVHSLLDQFSALMIIRLICGTVMTAAVMVFGFLTINRNIVWRSGKHLLIYSYAAIAALAVTGAFDFTSAVIVFLPILIQESSSEKDVRGIAGGSALIVMGILPWAANFIYRHLNGRGASAAEIITGHSPAGSVIDFNVFLNISIIVFYVFTAIAPLMAFERKCGETGMLSAVTSDEQEKSGNEQCH